MHIQTSAEFLDSLTQEDINNWSARQDKAEDELPAIRERIEKLYAAIDDGWAPLRTVHAPLDNLDRGLSVWLVAERSKYVRQTLEEAEADLAAWRRMSPHEQQERVSANERDEAERLARREAAAQISQRQNAFYAAMFAAGISPIPMSVLSTPGLRLSESSRKLNEIEQQISNLGNDL
jgi:chromosome segregation ATPase